MNDPNRFSICAISFENVSDTKVVIRPKVTFFG